MKDGRRIFAMIRRQSPLAILERAESADLLRLDRFDRPYTNKKSDGKIIRLNKTQTKLLRQKTRGGVL